MMSVVPQGYIHWIPLSLAAEIILLCKGDYSVNLYRFRVMANKRQPFEIEGMTVWQQTLANQDKGRKEHARILSMKPTIKWRGEEAL